MSYVETSGKISAKGSSTWIGDDFPLYKYAPLPDEKNCIRLIEVLPQSDHEHLRCRIHIETSRPFRTYEAISYCWGDPFDTGDIQCEGTILGIPRNLRDALEHFRLPDRSRILWADAICINQRDKKEQGHQVMQMGRIFKEAECVLIWLGRGTGINAQAAFDLITYLEHIASSVTEPSRSIGEKHLAHIVERFPVESWTALGEVLGHSYFERIWVLQEVGLAARALLFCGRVMIDWKAFSETCTWLSFQTRLFTQYRLPGSCDGLFSVRGMHRMNFKNQPPQSWKQIYPILSRTAWYKSTDPRDKVYALLGHPTFVNVSRELLLESFVPIEYSNSPFDTFLNVATALMKFPKPLRILNFVCHEHSVEENVEGFISWVPQWAWQKRVTDLLESPYGNPDFISRFDPRFEIRDRQLHISGGILDSVIYSSEKFDANPFRPDQQDHSVDAARNRLIQAWNDIKGIVDRHTEEDVFQDMCDSVTAGGAGIYKTSARGIDIDRPQNQESAKAALRTDFFWYMNLAGAQFSNKGILERLQSSNGDPWRLWRYGSFLKQRCIFVTAGGHLGIGSGPMKTGDLVCFFYGAPFPSIIRQVPEKPGYWFIGQCYVSGIEKMAAMKQAELGDLKEDTFILY